ncbi:MAG: SDR family oxidoreductase [Firmicutes bacterium]|nr:SDR family oxidoreductase [Bacillota bacterium]
MDVRGKTVLVTGGNTGIGRAISMDFASHGANVCIGYFAYEEEADSAVKEMKKMGVEAKAYPVDISKEEQVIQLIHDVAKDFGSLNVLINCAGRTHVVAHPDLYGMKSEYWDDIFGVNVKGTFFCCREAKPYLENDGGVIVNITSTGGLNGLGSSIAYSASKAAEINMTRSLARVFAPAVRVLGVAPGFVSTQFVAGQEARGAKNASETCMKRLAEPKDIADVVGSLVYGNDILTGINVVVDGGRVF